MLEADPLDANVYYILYLDDTRGHFAWEIDMVVKRHVEQLLRSLDDGGDRSSKFVAKKQPPVVRLAEDFHDEMFRVLLPAFKRILSVDEQDKNPGDVLDAVGVTRADETVDVFIAYRDC